MTMFVFSRRAIQDKLEVLEDVLTSEQHAKLVDRLNQPGRDQMAVMWEAVFLHAMDQVVPIRLEVALSNGRQPAFGLNLFAKEQDLRSSVTSRTYREWAMTGRCRLSSE